MTFDVAVWEGAEPESDDAALAAFQHLYDIYVGRMHVPPTPRIRRFAETLLTRYPDLAADTEDLTPWATAPLLGEASGPFMYFALTASHPLADSAWRFAEQTARAQRLVLFDPQSGTVRTAPKRRRLRDRPWLLVPAFFLVWFLAGMVLSLTSGHPAKRLAPSPALRRALEIEGILGANTAGRSALWNTVEQCVRRAGYPSDLADAIAHPVPSRQQALGDCLGAGHALGAHDAAIIVNSGRAAGSAVGS